MLYLKLGLEHFVVSNEKVIIVYNIDIILHFEQQWDNLLTEESWSSSCCHNTPLPLKKGRKQLNKQNNLVESGQKFHAETLESRGQLT